jgi:hypothetical protein
MKINFAMSRKFFLGSNAAALGSRLLQCLQPERANQMNAKHCGFTT